jgi:RNA polymerase sigma-B factor
VNPLPTATADHRALFDRWRQRHDPRAREELIEQFMPLAHKLARRYLRAREQFDDLLQVARLGLIKAVDRFDPDRGTAFTTFAVPTILGELKRYLRDTGWSVRVPRGTHELALKVKQAERKLSAQAGTSPTVPQLAQYLEVSVEQVIDALQAAAGQHATSLDAPVDDGDHHRVTLAETLGAHDARLDLVGDSATIAAAWTHLSTRERHVLELRFGEDLTQTEIAARIGLSQMQVSRIQRRALTRLRELADPETGGEAV